MSEITRLNALAERKGRLAPQLPLGTGRNWDTRICPTHRTKSVAESFLSRVTDTEAGFRTGAFGASVLPTMSRSQCGSVEQPGTHVLGLLHVRERLHAVTSVHLTLYRRAAGPGTGGSGTGSCCGCRHSKSECGRVHG